MTCNCGEQQRRQYDVHGYVQHERPRRDKYQQRLRFGSNHASRHALGSRLGSCRSSEEPFCSLGLFGSGRSLILTQEHCADVETRRRLQVRDELDPRTTGWFPTTTLSRLVLLNLSIMVSVGMMINRRQRAGSVWHV